MSLRFDWLPQALFLDRDGTLIEHRPYLHEPEEVVLIDGVREALAEAKEWGCHLFLHTNQSGVGRGYFERRAVDDCNDRMLDLLNLGGELFSEICVATENPETELPLYRKPSPRFEREMAQRFDLNLSRCVMIGDRECDVETGVNAGMAAVGVWRMGDDEARRDRFEALGATVAASVGVYWQQLKAENQVR